MAPDELVFTDLDRIVDDVHDAFAVWERDGTLTPPLDAFAVEVLKIAVHEWVANLVQHARFGGRAPRVRFRVEARPDGVHCVIEDNSDGFSFQAQLGHQEHHLEEEPFAERGRGLLMLIACTRDLRYEAVPAGEASGDGAVAAVQRLAFLVPPSDPVTLSADLAGPEPADTPTWPNIPS